MSIALALSPLIVVGVGALLLMLIEAFSAPSPGQVGAHGTAGLALGTTTVLFTSMAFAATLWMVGVEHVAAEGQKFDPHVHEAVAQEASKEVPEGHVISQLRRGFKLKDRLIRPASVVVSKGAE